MLDYKQIVVLVADDEPDLREAILLDLEFRKLQVIGAPSGNTAIAILQSKKVDIVISDIRMPDGDGLSLLQHISALPAPRPVTILMSGYSNYSDEDCIRRGALCVLAKPFNSQQLWEAVQTAIKLNNNR